MINLTDILTKPVLSLSCTKCEGIVKSAIFNNKFKRLKYLVLFDEEEDLEDKVLHYSSIFSNGENAIVIKDDQYLTPLSASLNTLDKPSPINSKVYTFLGKYLGTIQEVVLTDSFFVHSIKTANQEILSTDIISFGENVIFVQDENKKAKISSLKKRKSTCVKIQDIKVSADQKVYILSPTSSSKKNSKKTQTLQTDSAVLNAKPQNIDLNERAEKVAEPEDIPISPITPTEINSSEDASNLDELNNFAQTAPEKPKLVYSLTEEPSKPGLVISNFEFLIGRKLGQNIYSSNNELIARKNTKITTDTIIKARLFNKTRELVKFSR